MKRIKASAALVCEYISHAAAGKFTCVNVYGGSILVREFPATIPLAFLVELPPGRELPKLVSLEIFNGKKLFASADVEPDKESPEVTVVPLPTMPFAVEGDTTVSIFARGEGFSRSALMKKSIRKGDFPT